METETSYTLRLEWKIECVAFAVPWVVHHNEVQLQIQTIFGSRILSLVDLPHFVGNKFFLSLHTLNKLTARRSQRRFHLLSPLLLNMNRVAHRRQRMKSL
jgi:hypothetical protein